jgi:hypothetical protein
MSVSWLAWLRFTRLFRAGSPWLLAILVILAASQLLSWHSVAWLAMSGGVLYLLSFGGERWLILPRLEHRR